MYILRGVEERSWNNYYSRKIIIITYFDCVFVASGVQHAKRMLRIVNCVLFGSTVFFSHCINATMLKRK